MFLSGLNLSFSLHANGVVFESIEKNWKLKKVWNSFNVSIVFFLNQIYYFYYSLYIILFIFFYLFVLKQCYTKFTYFKHHITIFNFSLFSHSVTSKPVHLHGLTPRLSLKMLKYITYDITYVFCLVQFGKATRSNLNLKGKLGL